MSSMTDRKVKQALGEAYKFIKLGEDLVSTPDHLTRAKKSGACRRSSMDLTRALARMRSYADD